MRSTCEGHAMCRRDTSSVGAHMATRSLIDANRPKRVLQTKKATHGKVCESRKRATVVWPREKQRDTPQEHWGQTNCCGSW